MDDTLRVRTRICITMYISKYPAIAATVTFCAYVCYTLWIDGESRGQKTVPWGILTRTTGLSRFIRTCRQRTAYSHRPHAGGVSIMADGANAGLIWSIAELLRGDYKQSDYGKVILPFTLLQRLDGVLAPTKTAVLEEYARLRHADYDISFFLTMASGQSF